MSDAGNEKWKYLIYIPLVFEKSHHEEALRTFLASSADGVAPIAHTTVYSIQCSILFFTTCTYS